jgi:hypothetical protein
LLIKFVPETIRSKKKVVFLFMSSRIRDLVLFHPQDLGSGSWMKNLGIRNKSSRSTTLPPTLLKNFCSSISKLRHNYPLPPQSYFSLSGPEIKISSEVGHGQLDTVVYRRGIKKSKKIAYAVGLRQTPIVYSGRQRI